MSEREDFERAKDMMRGAFMPDYEENGVESQVLWQQVIDELGIYPAAVVRKDGTKIKRTEWQDGWNSAVMTAINRMIALLKEKAGK